jgi:hypothetical protein
MRFSRLNPTLCTPYLDFFKSETTTGSQLHVVTKSRAADSRAEKTVDGTRGHTGSLLDTSDTARLLLTGLIKPGLDTALPFLAEMLVRQLVVVFQNHVL